MAGRTKHTRGTSKTGTKTPPVEKAYSGPLPGHQVEESPKSVVVEGITVDGILREMQIAYQMVRPANTSDPVGIRRWRRLFLVKPERFMAILEAQEKRFLARQEEAKAQQNEFEKLKAEVPKLKADLTAALKELAELRAMIPSELDEYDDPGLERVNELMDKLLDGYGAKPGLSP